MFNRNLGALCLFALATQLLHAQAKHTATREGDLQIGAAFVTGDPDYGSHINGVGFYADLDHTSHWGGEFEFHQANSSRGDHTYERTYELGARYRRTYGIAVPYAKALIGRGVFNFPGQFDQKTNAFGPSVANLAYNMYAAAVGCDLNVRPYLNVRADYEYQRWVGFPPNGLTPQLFTIGVAYHFPGGLPRRHR